jgi:hypothetical protein
MFCNACIWEAQAALLTVSFTATLVRCEAPF